MAGDPVLINHMIIVAVDQLESFIRTIADPTSQAARYTVKERRQFCVNALKDLLAEVAK